MLGAKGNKKGPPAEISEAGFFVKLESSDELTGYLHQSGQQQHDLLESE